MGKTVLVTGASRGLGQAFVKYFLSIGDTVFAGVRDIPSENNEANLHFVKLNVTDNNSIEDAVLEVKKQTSSLDFLINNAGVNKDTATNEHKEYVSKLGTLKRESLQYMFDVNTISPLIVTQCFLPLLNSNPSFVINISSDRASFHDEFENTYANYGYRASKVALNMATFCLPHDLPNNIKTFAVHPGDMKTDMNPDGVDDVNIQAKKVISITENWKEEWNGKFMRYDGSLYPL